MKIVRAIQRPTDVGGETLKRILQPNSGVDKNYGLNGSFNSELDCHWPHAKQLAVFGVLGSLRFSNAVNCKDLANPLRRIGASSAFKNRGARGARTLETFL